MAEDVNKIRQATGTDEDVEFLSSLKGKTADTKCKMPKGGNQYLILIKVSDGDSSILYEYDMFLECLITSRIKNITDKDKNIHQFKIFNQLNFDLLRIIGQIRLDTNGYEPLKNYHVEEKIRMLETAINNLKLELEVEKLDKENRLFALPYWFSGIALIASVATPIIINELQDKSEPQKIIMLQEAQTQKMPTQGAMTSSGPGNPLNKEDASLDTSAASDKPATGLD